MSKLAEKLNSKAGLPFAIVDRCGDAVRPAMIQFRSFKVSIRFDRRKETGVMSSEQACMRCGGAGGARHWPGYTCYRCGGSGIDHKRYEVKIYTRRKQEKLEAAAEKRRAKKAAKEQAYMDGLMQDPLFARIQELKDHDDFDFGGFMYDVHNKWYKFGSISDAQRAGLEKAVAGFEKFQQVKADRIAAQVPAPEGKVQIEGIIVKFKCVENCYGSTLKMLVECDGYKVWGSVPKALMDAVLDDTVRFTATVERSRDDESFAFFKRPTKAVIVNEEQA